MGYLPDRFPALLRMPAAVCLRHLAAVRGAPAADAARRATDLLAALGFSGGAGTPAARLSKGNAQKVGLAQALCCGPGLPVLDEPWSGLDVDAAAVLAARLDEAVADGDVGAARRSRRAGWAAGRRPGAAVGGRHAHPDHGNAALADRVVVELRCAGDPAALLRELPAVGESWLAPGRLTVWVGADRSDAVLATALARGCSVLGVRREPAGSGL